MATTPALSQVSEPQPIDAVFVIGTGSENNNEELRYALRNLESNCPFIRDVYISGECPDWVNKEVVHHLPWPDRFKHAKDANIVDKLRHACEQEGIADNILFCSDDQFQTRVCAWEDFSPRWLRQYASDDSWYESRKRLWHSRLHRTLERDRLRREGQSLDTSSIYYYQPHIWMQINKSKFIEYAKWSDYEHRDDTIIASGYFNFIKAGGAQNFDHVFISDNQKWPVDATHIAYTDSSFRAAMTYLKEKFSTPSKYEISAKQPDKASRSEDAIITDFKKQVTSERIWNNLAEEVAIAEDLRKNNVTGWKKVWNDLIHRWNVATDKGKNKVAVTAPRSPEAESIVRSRLDNLSVGSSKVLSGQVTAVFNNTPPIKKATCTKCEEKRRKAQEEVLQRHRRNIAAVNRELKQRNEPAQSESEACLDCALEHLSVAIAYLGSNMERPTMLDCILAQGEVKLAAQQLLALGFTEDYTHCLDALDSFRTPNSIFTASTFKNVLKNALNHPNNA